MRVSPKAQRNQNKCEETKNQTAALSVRRRSLYPCATITTAIFSELEIEANRNFFSATPTDRYFSVFGFFSIDQRLNEKQIVGIDFCRRKPFLLELDYQAEKHSENHFCTVLPLPCHCWWVTWVTILKW